MYNMNRRSSNRSGKNSPKGLLIAAVVMILLSAGNNMTGSGIVLLALLVPVLGIAIFFGIFRFVAKSAEKSNAQNKKYVSKEDGYCKTCSDEFVYNNVQNEYKEYSIEENFERDKKRRMKQLDDFLKNGLIDREEYLVLRSHYDK